MARYLASQLMALTLLAPVAHAQTSTETDDPRRRLIEQKIRLVESLMNTPAAVESARRSEPDTPAPLLLGKVFLERVRMALAANRMDEAAAALDEALRSAIKASNKQAPGAQGDVEQRQAFKNLTEQVATFRAALDDLAKQGNADARVVVARIDALATEARHAAIAGQWPDANRKLTTAYQHAIESLSKLRAGQTVTLSLKFDTPAEEFDYERKRFQSTELLVGMMLADGRAAGERRNLVDTYLRDGRRLHGTAADQAGAADYKGAVATMESAIGHLNRALQLMGVPVF